MQKEMLIKLGIMTAVSFVAMYLLMYTMIDGLSDFYLNLNQIYMAGTMTAAMVAIELIVMGAMYKNAIIRNAIIAASVLLTILLVLAIRFQVGIGNTQFLRSMIPHHSGAILMCDNEKITDTEIKALCKTISKGQREEIDQMNAILSR